MPAHPGAATPRVLVIGIDGVRYGLLAELPTPHPGSIAEAGFLAPVEVDGGTPTMSGPCRATILTGVGPAKHGGPTPEAWDECDEQVTAEAVHVLATCEPEASFVHLGAVDETAHFLGCGPDYRRAVLRADERLGRLLAAVRSRKTYASEAWTVIVVTDHGHVDAGGHGGDTVEERTAWVACAGPQFAPGRPGGAIGHPDVAAQVYASLGRPIDPHWTLDGSPFPATEPAGPTPLPAWPRRTPTGYGGLTRGVIGDTP